MALELKVTGASGKDVGRALVRLDPADLRALGANIGDILEIAGKRHAVGKALPTHHTHRGQACILMDGIARENAGVGLGETVSVRKIDAPPAEEVDLLPTTPALAQRDLAYIAGQVDGLPILKDDQICVPLFGGRPVDFKVARTRPEGPVVICPETRLKVGPAQDEGRDHRITYEDIGGLGAQVARIREMIELPLRYPEVFDRLGIDAPKGVLLHGPPGCGKTLIARAIAHEAGARFFAISGPEIIHKFYGESEARLRNIFEEAGRKGPSIVFLDEIDAIAPRPEQVTGEVEKRVVAQLLALMDGLTKRENLIVIAATNLPNAIDPALRRPGRFDREIAIPIPDRPGRSEILEIHSRGMSLAHEVDLSHLAGITHGFVGADLEALCREAAMRSLRRLTADTDFGEAAISYEQLSKLEVRMDDFLSALQEIEPPAIREVFVETPDVSWRDLGELHGVKSHHITQIKEAEEALKRQTEELRRSNAELEQFAYVASHDLQEPLRKIQTFANVLKESLPAEVMGEDEADCLDRMLDAAGRMRTLIDDLLTFSRITTWAKGFSPVNLNEVTSQVLSDLEILVRQSNAQVDVGQLPVVEAEPTQMRQLLQNLISNALKFHRPDVPPHVEIYGKILKNSDPAPIERPPHCDLCQIIIKDNGIGFNEKYLDRIFVVFQRLHGRGLYEGTGIGLAICRKIVERHAGHITAKSKPESGATFVVTLPLKQPKREDFA